MQCKTTQCAIIKCAFGCNGIIWHEPRYRQNMNSLNSSFSDRMTERATTSKLLNNFFILTHTSHSQTLCRFTQIHLHISTLTLTHTETHSYTDTRALYSYSCGVRGPSPLLAFGGSGGSALSLSGARDAQPQGCAAP